MTSNTNPINKTTIILVFVMLLVVLYLPSYAPQIIEYLNKFPFFSSLVEITINNPFISLFVFSAVFTLISTLLMKYLTDQDHLKVLKKRQKELQKEIKEAQNKKEFTKLEELNKDLVDLSLSLMKASFSIKMMVITVAPFLLFFLWIKQIYVDTLGWKLWTFFLYYILFAIIMSTLYRKLFKMA